MDNTFEKIIDLFKTLERDDQLELINELDSIVFPDGDASSLEAGELDSDDEKQSS